MNLIKNKTAFILLFSFLGFLDATYLTILHYKHIIPPCTIAHGCDTVLTSQFSTIGPVPIALLGSLFYIALIFLSIMLLNNPKKLFIQGLYFLGASGAIVSLVLIYLQAFVIHAFCQYCLLSEAINFTIFVFVFLKFKETGKVK